MTHVTKTLPYELLAEQMAKEAVEHSLDKYGQNPHVVARHLATILQEAIHDGIEIGLGIADSFQPVGPAEISVAYATGYQQGKSEIEE